MAKKKKYTLRKFINDVHLWLGLGSGIILFLVCLSGTALTFEKEIKALFTSELKVEAGSNPIPIEALAENLKAEGAVNSVTIDSNPAEPYKFSVKTSAEDRRGTTYFVDQFTGEFSQAAASPLDGFFMSMFKLHRWLLLDTETGRPIVGIATIIFFFIALSGVVLWFPKKMKWKNMKAGFKIKTSANWKRINHDLHNSLGFYACIFLVIMTLTGLFWSFEWYKDAGSKVLGTQVFGGRGGPGITSEGDFDDTQILSIAEIQNIAAEELNYEGNITISFPAEENGVYSIRKYNNASWSPVTADNLILDRDGQMLNKELFRDKPLNVQIASLIKPIHTGEIFGIYSKIIYFIACLIATSLPVTGTLIWWNKRTKSRKKIAVNRI